MSYPLITLYTPGTRPELAQKAEKYDIDSIIIDLEDTVPPDMKAETRGIIAELIPTLPNKPLVRVNNDSDLLEDDLRAVITPNTLGILFPKAETVEDLKSVDKVMKEAEAATGLETGSVRLLLQIESALGVLRCFDLCMAADRIDSVSFGSAEDGDLQRDLGCEFSLEGTELMYARSKVLLEARAAKMPYVLDGAFSDVSNVEAFRTDSILSRRLGYDGRTCVHPAQVDAAREIYSLSDEQTAYYRKVVEEFEAALKDGAASIKVDGKMVDNAMYVQAKSVLDRFGG